MARNKLINVCCMPIVPERYVLFIILYHRIYSILAIFFLVRVTLQKKHALTPSFGNNSNSYESRSHRVTSLVYLYMSQVIPIYLGSRVASFFFCLFSLTANALLLLPAPNEQIAEGHISKNILQSLPLTPLIFNII